MNPINEVFILFLVEDDLQIWERVNGENLHLCSAVALAGDIFNCSIEAGTLPLDTSVLLITPDSEKKHFEAVLVRSAWFKIRMRNQKNLEELCAKAITTEIKTTSVIRYDGKKYSYYDNIPIKNYPLPEVSVKKIELAQIEEVVSMKPIPYLGLPTDKTRICRHCGKIAEGLRRCGRCKKIYYCSLEHQRADWQRHKQTCA